MKLPRLLVMLAAFACPLSVTVHAEEPAAQPSPSPSPIAEQNGTEIRKTEAQVQTDLTPPIHDQETFHNWGATVSANVPHPIFLELEHRFTPAWSMGAGAGGLSLSNLTISGTPTSLSMAAADARVRWHPWRGAFFLGMGLGFQKVSGSTTENIPIPVNSSTVVINTTVTATIQSLYATPQLGWFWVSKSGFTLGFDFGIQLPFAPRSSVSLATNNADVNGVLPQVEATPEYKKAQSDVNDVGDKFGKIPLPYVTVLRLGWMF